MAGSDDELEKLLREVDGALGGKAAPPAKAQQPTTAQSEGSLSRRIEQAIPVALLAGAVPAAVIWVVFAFVPFVSSLSGSLGAFVGGFTVSLLGRLRRGA